ncbi:MAG TPA: hypothetical protein VFE14_07050 [Micromonosporaceae bacterium]|nr:hypothetical protein [Micromonosporaceae bacterium]
MRARAFGTLAAWLAATGLAVAVSWYGLRPVLHTAVPDPAIPLSAEQLRRLSPAAAPPAAAIPTPTSGPSPSPRTSRPPADPPRTPSRTPPVPTAPGPPPPVSIPYSPPPASSHVVYGWTVVVNPDGTMVYLRTFETLGGEVAAKVSVGSARLVSATPREYYTFRVEQPSASRLVVQFWTATGKMSTVDVMWWDGGPWYQITEQSWL